jgi:hypothetical protein
MRKGKCWVCCECCVNYNVLGFLLHGLLMGDVG